MGQPARTESKSGSTIRIDQVKAEAGQYAVYFHCQTDLVETFRELYPGTALRRQPRILLDAGEKVPEAALRHCVAQARRIMRGSGRRRNNPSLRAKRSNP